MMSATIAAPRGAVVSGEFGHRNMAIDMLRALTMFTMIFVNNFWKVEGVPHWLEHAEYGEDFMGLADVVFPCFLFAVGMSIPYAIEARKARGYSDSSTLGHIFSRTFALLVMGAFLGNSERWISSSVPYCMGVYWILMFVGFIGVWNQYPRTDSVQLRRCFQCCKAVGWGVLIYLAVTFRNADGGVFSFSTSILGLIAWAYLICSLIYFVFRGKTGSLITAWCLFIVINILFSPLGEAYGGHPLLELPEHNFIDGFLWSVKVGNGGLVSCTMGGVVLSVLSVRYINRSDNWKLSVCLIAAALFAALGFEADHYYLTSKIEATIPWVFFITSISVGLYGLFTWLVSRGYTGWFRIIKPAGTATLTAYIVPYLMYAFNNITDIGFLDFSWFRNGTAGLVNCICFSFFCIFLTWLLGKVHIKLKI